MELNKPVIFYEEIDYRSCLRVLRRHNGVVRKVTSKYLDQGMLYTTTILIQNRFFEQITILTREYYLCDYI